MEKNEQEFTRLVEKYKSTVYAVCYMFSDSRDELDDLFQEVLVKLWKGYGSFREESDIRTWIYRVSLNCCLNLQKRKKREAGHIPLSIDIDPFEGTSDRALILLWLEGMSYAEIGEIIGISVKNVSFQLYRIKEELKKMTI